MSSRLTMADRTWRYTRVRKLMEEKGVETLLICDLSAFGGWVRYFTGEYYPFLFGTNYLVFSHEKDPTLFCFRDFSGCGMWDVRPGRVWATRYMEVYMPDPWVTDIRPTDPKNIIQAINEHYTGNGKIGIVRAFFPTDMYNAVTSAFPKAEWVEMTEDLTALRRVKSDSEVAIARETTVISDELHDLNKEFIRPGVCLHEIHAEWAYHMMKKGADRLLNDVLGAHPTDISAVGYPWGHPPKPVEVGESLSMEMTVCLAGYMTQRVANYSVGRQEPELTKLFDVTRDALNTGMNMIRPGAKVSDVFTEMNRVINDHGYLHCEQFLAACAGHHCGMNADEGTLSSKSNLVFEKNNVIVLHPSAAVQGWTEGRPAIFGPGIMLVVTENGCESLHRPDFQLEFPILG